MLTFSSCRLAAPLVALLAGVVLLADDKPAAKLPPDLALLPADTMAFVTFQPAKLAADPLVKALGTGGTMAKVEGEILLGLPVSQVERATLVFRPNSDPAVIVQTRKPYDKATVLKALGKDAITKAVGGKTLHAPKGGGNVTVWFVDGQRFAIGFGGSNGVLAGLSADNAGPKLLGDAARLAAAGKHQVVAGVDVGGLLVENFRELVPFGEGDEFFDDRKKGETKKVDLPVPPPPPPPIKCAGEEAEQRKEPPPPPDRKVPARKLPTREWVLERLSPEMLPYKPLLLARTATLSLSRNDGIEFDAAFRFASAEEATEGELALRMSRYVVRELVPMVFREGLMFARHPKLSAQLKQMTLTTIHSAQVGRAGETARVSARLKAETDLLAEITKMVSDSAIESAATNNLKQIALAMHNYEAATGRLPTQAILDKDGKPLLSWRVAILPYVEEYNLYKQFKLDEAWDSPHNKKLIEKMPKVYRHTVAKAADPNATFYQVFTGPESLFRPGAKQGLILGGVADGTSNTALVIEAGEAVTWTKPADVVVDPKKPLPKLGDHFKGIVYVARADGSVGPVRANLDDKTWRMFINPVDGFVLPDITPRGGK